MRAIPSIDAILKAVGNRGLPRPLAADAIRREVAAIRSAAAPDLTREHVFAQSAAAVERLRLSRTQTVINASGIIVHTNLGRSPLSDSAARALDRAARTYGNLEFDLADGQRGGRGRYVEQALATLCGSESATVVNNCAAALVLVLRSFAARPPRNRVVISRGELVQIGGGFRIPNILESAGVELREVGTTNRTTIEDYRHAIDDRTALILKVHPSNFFMEGFVAAPATGELAALAREKEIPLVEDIGSGATFDTGSLGGGEQEPTPLTTLAGGADLVCFSGDKLLGGPQAGIIAGRADHIAALKKHPFFRALRCDKLILAALEATLDALLDGRAQELPIRKMMRIPLADLHQRAQAIAANLSHLGNRVRIGECSSQVGGGSLPRTRIASVSIDLLPRDTESVDELVRQLRQGDPPIIGSIHQGRLKLDLRTVFPHQDETLGHRIGALA